MLCLGMHAHCTVMSCSALWCRCFRIHRYVAGPLYMHRINNKKNSKAIVINTNLVFFFSHIFKLTNTSAILFCKNLLYFISLQGARHNFTGPNSDLRKLTIKGVSLCWVNEGLRGIIFLFNTGSMRKDKCWVIANANSCKNKNPAFKLYRCYTNEQVHRGR